MDYLQALAAACRLALAVGHLTVRVVGFPLDPVAGYRPVQAAVFQRVPVAVSPPVPVVVSQLDPVVVFLQGLAAVFQLALEVECPLGRHRTAATYPLGMYSLQNWKGEVCSNMPTSSKLTCDKSDMPHPSLQRTPDAAAELKR